MRVLLSCSLGGAGHLNPLRAFIDVLVQRGNEVVLVVPPSLEDRAADIDCCLRVGAEPSEADVAPLLETIASAPAPVAAVASERELFGRLCTVAMLPAMTAAFSELQPDLVLHETCEYSAVVAACRAGVPHAQVAISQGKVESSALDIAAAALEPHLIGAADEIRSSPYLTRFPASLDPVSYPDTRRYKVPSKGQKAPLPRWWGDDSTQLVYVSFGTVTGRMSTAAVYRTSLEAVSQLPVRALLTVGKGTELARLGPIPDNVHVEDFVAQDDVFEEASLVICHGGSGTTFGALAAGLPIVFVPLFADQFANAVRVTEVGAGLRVEPKHQTSTRPKAEDYTPSQIVEAVRTVLGDGSYRKAAARVAQEMRSLPSVEEILGRLGAPSAPREVADPGRTRPYC